MRNIQELIQLIQDRVSALEIESQPAGMYEPISYMMNIGGKRIRPLLCLLAYRMYAGEDRLEEVMAPALGIEMFHNFTLMHDDVMDRSFMRRGKPCVHVKWDENTAILSGDALQILAYQYVQQAPEQYLKACLDLFSRTAMELCEGQALDMLFETQERVDKDDYLEMIRKKTAVLLACSLKMGAIIAGAPRQDQDLLYEYGINIGIAFQIKDDLLDVWGNPAVFGKAIGGDIMCNKKTFLLIHAMEQADEHDRHFLQEYLRTNDIDRGEKVETVTRMYNRLGVREVCEAQMGSHQEKALLALRKLSVPEQSWDDLRVLAEKMMNRQW